MGIALKDDDLLLALDDAIALARSASGLPPVWVQRVERLGRLGVKTYIAALGGALLAKATDPRVDSLAQDEHAGPRGYSLRKATEFLAVENKGRYHLGAQGRWPLNNRPFLGGPPRIDEFTKIAPKARPAFELFLDCVTDLNRLDRPNALSAFAAFLRVRMAAAQAARAASQQALSLRATIAADELLGICERFIREDAEGGRRGQAFAAAVLDCVFPDVRLQPINDPKPGDARVVRDGRTSLPVEIKQVAVEERTALKLAAEAQDLGADAALLLVLADRHSPLDRERVRRQALREFGVMLEVCESVREFVGAVSVFSGGNTQRLLERLPGAYAARMREHEVSEFGQRRWRELIEARGP
jgi:SacI restriction endonuclease